MVIWSQRSATPKISNFQNFTIGHQNNYFTIFLIYKTQRQVKSLKNYQRLCFKNFPQPWKKLVETKVENPVNSRNDTIFQIPNSPSYPSIPMFNLASICSQKPKTLRTSLNWGESGFFHWKIDFLFCLNSFIQNCRLVFDTWNFDVWNYSLMFEIIVLFLKSFLIKIHLQFLQNQSLDLYFLTSICFATSRGTLSFVKLLYIWQ